MAHKNPKYKDRFAFAPYNFVPLPPKIMTVPMPFSHDTFEGYSGHFSCTFQTNSPLYIRGMLSDNEYGIVNIKSKPNHFSINSGQSPTIPGSSLRGVFRTLVEILTYSKIQPVTQQNLVYRTVDTTSHGATYRQRITKETFHNHFLPQMKGGYIREYEGKWYIQPAQEISGTTFGRINISEIPDNLSLWHGCKKAAFKIFIKPGNYEYQDVRGGFLKIKFSKISQAKKDAHPDLLESALIYSGPMHNKEKEAVIFPPDTSKSLIEDWLPIEDELRQIYEEQISPQQERVLGSKKGVLQNYHPVFYLIENDQLIFFGHTMMFRIPYKNSPYDLIPEHLKNMDSIDMTEALFGYVNPTKKQALAGRLYFSDATCLPDQGDVFEETAYLPVLSSPKPTTFQHYLEQPKPDDKLRLLNYDSDTQIRGHKLYWHQGPLSIEDIEEKDEEKIRRDQQKPIDKQQHPKIKAVKKGVNFEFKIYFNNLDSKELGMLLWLLTVVRQPNYSLSLGMGKPLGMGAIRITQKPKPVLFDRKTRYLSLFNSNDWETGNIAIDNMQDIFKKSIKEFENWLLEDTIINPEKKYGNLVDIPRIQNLLKMLSWPGPDRKYTRYMVIRNHIGNNEYINRPVLPTPLGISKYPTLNFVAPEPEPFISELLPENNSGSQSNTPEDTQKPLEKPSQLANDIASLIKDNQTSASGDTQRKSKKKKKY